MHLRKALFPLSLASLLAFSLNACQAAEKVELNVGDDAPHFSGVDDQNKPWDSKEKAKQKIYVVYFYPADMTGGCTAQACAYRDAVKEMKREDVEIIGVSGDSVENHQHFKNEYELNFTLLADTDGKIADAFGVSHGGGGSFTRELGGKEITFERGVTSQRWTFVIDKDWKIAHKDTKVNAGKDSEKVQTVIEKLK